MAAGDEKPPLRSWIATALIAIVATVIANLLLQLRPDRRDEETGTHRSLASPPNSVWLGEPRAGHYPMGEHVIQREDTPEPLPVAVELEDAGMPPSVEAYRASRLEREHRQLEREIGALQTRLMSEPSDEAWSAELIQNLEDRLASHGFPSISDHQCTETLCRIGFMDAPLDVYESLYEFLSSRDGIWNHQLLYTRGTEDPSGYLVHPVVYVSRSGYPLLR